MLLFAFLTATATVANAVVLPRQTRTLEPDTPYQLSIDSSNPALSGKSVTRSTSTPDPITSLTTASLGYYPGMQAWRFTVTPDGARYVLSTYNPVSASPEGGEAHLGGLNLTAVLREPGAGEGQTGQMLFEDMVLDPDTSGGQQQQGIFYTQFGTYSSPAGTRESLGLLRYADGPENPDGWVACPDPAAETESAEGWYLSWVDWSKTKIPQGCEVVRLLPRQA